jgi:transaldolase / glucose-6-phosphate isomerase
MLSQGVDMTPSDTTTIGKTELSLGAHTADVNARIEQFDKDNVVSRIWQKDAKLWSGADEAKWLGWLDIASQQLKNVNLFRDLAADISKAGFQQALLLGMGGSSLCVEVLRLTFGTKQGYPDMHVLDSTVPAQVLRTRQALDLKKTLVIVASKSGGTTEPNVLLQYFYDEVKKEVGDKVGEHFIAITDPGSSMEKTAQELKFRKTFYGIPEIGGRFSALSNFGMIPSAVMGYDVEKFLRHAEAMEKACGKDFPVKENPGALLGTVMGTLAGKGVDKVTVITSPAIHSLGAWLEQLLAESTGKQGKGLIPVAGEKLEPADKYGKDRLFAYVRLANGADAAQDKAVKALADAGHPVITMEMPSKEDLGAEFFRWEFATAVAGVALGINAFDQPNVQESKDYTKKYLAEYTEKGKLPEDILLLEEDGIKLYVDQKNKEVFEKAGVKGLDAAVKAHLDRIKEGDYFATNAYIDRTPQLEAKLDELRLSVMEKKHVATTVGFGPRFLHSTGQLHKGGPNKGVFLQVTSEDAKDVAIPAEKFTFGVLKQAQALGDFLALSNRDRRLLRVHLPADVEKGLARIKKAFEAALK